MRRQWVWCVGSLFSHFPKWPVYSSFILFKSPTLTTHHILGCWVCLLLHEWKGSNQTVIFFILYTDERLGVFTLFTRQQHLCSHPKPSLPVELWAPSFLPSQDQFLQGQSHQRKKHFHISLFIKWKNFLSLYPPPTTERLHFHFSLSCIGEGNGNPLQCSCLENPRDRGAWWAAIYGVA